MSRDALAQSRDLSARMLRFPVRHFTSCVGKREECRTTARFGHPLKAEAPLPAMCLHSPHLHRVRKSTAGNHCTSISSADMGEDGDTLAATGPAKVASIETSANVDVNTDVNTDPDIVNWDGDDDPQNPRNWSQRFKLVNVLLIGLSVLCTYAQFP